VNTLEQKAHELFPDNEARRSAWLRSVLWLREKSKCGYSLDKIIPKDAKPPLLQGFRAPEEVKVAVSLPDERVMPGVVSIRRGKGKG
jgi:hypothetical protein